MDEPLSIVLKAIVSYFIKKILDFGADVIFEIPEADLGKDGGLRKALAVKRPFRAELRFVCAELGRNLDRADLSKRERSLWRLLSDEAFQDDLAEWLMSGCIEEGHAVRERLLKTMENALAAAGADEEQIRFLKNQYFEAIDKAIFAHQALAHWRHQLSLDFLREQVAVLRRRAEEAAGQYSPECQEAALDNYRAKALDSWDIVDLSNLPEGDIHIATQKLLLRQLYMPLRIEVEQAARKEDSESALYSLEDQRAIRRQRDAGHFHAEESPRQDRPLSRASVGECLAESRRLVVLGDPGGGKSTMLRWLATGYLLRHGDGESIREFPDSETLPKQPWLPVLIRCRDLGDADLCRSFTDFLSQHLYKTELLPKDADVMRAVILDRIAKGEVLLLVDGLDEITSPKVRMQFCQELERTAARYPETSIIVTSRIVGYRDMPYRMGTGFMHGAIAELNREDKDLFARRWVEVTEQHQPAAEKDRRVRELMEALQSSDRIERLTGNPMLLTTLTLVKRKVGKLPSRRNKLYAEAVSVLLNWNPRHYQTIEEEEAIPQLGYLAYEMCRRGVQRLPDNEVLDLLDRVRDEYKNLRAIRRRDSQAFLDLLEARSSILIKSGSLWQKNKERETPVWEFRHLTFQEYLAARALLDDRYPDRDKTKSLAEQVAPLAGGVEKVERWGGRPGGENEVPESWREALRLLVAGCRDDDVDDVLLVILTPQPGEDAESTARPRAVLAALCLADEPNVSEETAEKVLAAFAANVGEGDGGGSVRTSLDRAAMELGGSVWYPLLKNALLQEFIHNPPDAKINCGGLLAMIEVLHCSKSGLELGEVFNKLLEQLHSKDQNEMLTAAFTIMGLAFEQKAAVLPGLVDMLMHMIKGDAHCRVAGSWALMWLNGGFSINKEKNILWAPTEAEFSRLVKWIEQIPSDEKDAKRFAHAIISKGYAGKSKITTSFLAKNLASSAADVRLAIITALGQSGDKEAVSPLLPMLDDPDVEVRKATIKALAKLGDKQAVPALLSKLDDPDVEVRKATIEALAKLEDKQAIEPLVVLLADSSHNIRLAAANALVALGDERGTRAITGFLDHDDVKMRQAAVETLLKHRKNNNDDDDDAMLLSIDFDSMPWIGLPPWLDPREPITDQRIEEAAQKLGVTAKEARARYEALAADFHLRFA